MKIKSVRKTKVVIVPKWMCDRELPPSLKLIKECGELKELHEDDIIDVQEYNKSWHIIIKCYEVYEYDY